ncbi:MAG: phage head-tail connector protein [Clostridia bacterium]|nr:phage head-tail connector protein [Clostridia bacterium]
MDNQQKLALMRTHLPGEEVQDGLLLSLLEDASSLICALTWRKEVPPELGNAQVRLAVIFYNRMGMEGENAHQEGDVRRSVTDLPDALRKEIFAFRRACT